MNHAVGCNVNMYFCQTLVSRVKTSQEVKTPFHEKLGKVIIVDDGQVVFVRDSLEEKEMGQNQSSSSASKGAEEELKTLPAPQRHLVALDLPLEAKGKNDLQIRI